jgi:LuxR family maltose regulon positive regulatory protein
LPIAALRARGLLFEVGPELVSLSKREGETLLRGTNVGIDERQASELIDRSEGWAAGLYLAALAIRDGSGPDCERPSGDDRYLAEYFRSECLAAHSPQQLAFLRRTSILESLSAPICDAVLSRRDSARELAAIGASNLFVVPLDRSGKSYRYHRLFRDLLRSELEREEPELVAPLHRLAADWFETNDDPESAIAHAAAAGDMDRAARLISSLGVAVCDAGRIDAVERWLHHFDTASLERHPGVAVIGALVHARRGRRVEADAWLEIAAGRDADVRGCIAVVRAAMCESGVEAMLVDAEIALSALPAESSWRPIALLLHGVALALLDKPDAADASLALADDLGDLRGATDTRIAALSERALIAAGRGDSAAFEQFTHDARRLASTIEPQSSTIGVLLPAEFARLLLRRARWGEARAELTAARRQTTEHPAPFPWLAAQTHLELARAFMTLRDVGAAQLELDEAADILRGRRDLGILHAQANHLQSELDTVRDLRPGVEFRLTPAELRLIPLLASHLTFPKIAERFCLSRNTVKTQAISVYRKLGVSNRGDAIQQALRLGLLAGDVDEGADELESTERALVA